MQTRKRTISDLPWFCQNQVYAWLGYKRLFNRVLLEVVNDRHFVCRLSHIYNMEQALADARLNHAFFEDIRFIGYYEEMVRIKRVRLLRVRGFHLTAEDAQLVAEADARDARMNAFPWFDEADTEEEEEYEDLYPILH
jgi:hypothetical protein